MASINFFQEEVNYTLKHKRILRDWLHLISEQSGSQISNLNYIYCSDNYLLEINKTYLNHDYFTDIITFDNREAKDLPINADLFISIDRVRENAKTAGTSLQHELHRVMVHGLLHLLGQNDKTKAQQIAMTKKEEASLSLLHI